MHFLSVKDVASKFNISERRVQQLCDAGRIDGAQMISGVWVIPENATKPSDERISQTEQPNSMISLNELCSTLSISVATGRNWIKLGKLTPQSMVKKTAFFSTEYVAQFEDKLKEDKNTTLKSRRNKKYVSGNNIYNSYVSENSVAQRHVQIILDYIDSNNIDIDEIGIQTLVAEYAIQLLLHDTVFPFTGNYLDNYLNGLLSLNGYDFLVDDLIENKELSLNFIHKYPDLFKFTYQYEENEDFLGLLYISIKNIGSRKATGSYYTPTKVVKKLCTKLFEKNTTIGKQILDPCCGTGNFLLQLPNTISFDNIYGNDIDSDSVKITRINLAIKYSIKDKKKIYSHITNEDYLNHHFTYKFDYIIGNPPWGFNFSKEDKIRLKGKYSSAVGSNIESYDIFIEQALRDLKANGIISFVLPEAILNVKSHMPIRDILVKHTAFQYLDFLGNAFDKVQCPCIIFQVKRTDITAGCIGMEVQDCHRSFVIGTDRKITPKCFSFLTTDNEYSILEKIGDTAGKQFLAGNATFALGIVTGNNKEYISTTKTDLNEMVLKGSDLCKYRFNPTNNYIIFKPDSFQQIAPIEYYRASEKLLYRFICNQLVFAYDDHQTLSLNSCNLLIPNIEGLSVKYILSILNSRIAQYYFKKTFNSVKILRSHIEQIPIPEIGKKQQEDLLYYVNALIDVQPNSKTSKIYDELDYKIADIYGLSQREYKIILQSMNGENLFLT